MKSPLLTIRTFCVAALLAFGVSANAEESKIFEILPAKLENAKGKKVESRELEGKYVGLYFSAGWCPPCRTFTPHLVNFRNENAESFEVVFVSFDKSNMEKQKYVRKAEMPWLSIPGAGRRDANQLSKMFQVEGLPTLIVISPDGTVVSTTGREDVMSDPAEALTSWKKASQS